MKPLPALLLMMSLVHSGSLQEKPVLTVEPSGPQIFSGETVTFTCDLKQDQTSHWEYIWIYTDNSDRRQQLHCGSGSTCIIRDVNINNRTTYTCYGIHRQYITTQESNRVFLNITDIQPHAVLSVSPHSWMTEGVSVTLSCEVRESSTGWTFRWYRAVPYREELTPVRQSVGSVRDIELLSDSSRGVGGSYTLSPAALHHTGVYVCRAERGEPAYQTRYSNPQPLWITGLSPPVPLIIRPSRAQHFTGDTLSLHCEDSTGWTVRRYTHRGRMLDCSTGRGSVTGSTCNITSLHTYHSGLYWCQSESAGSGKAVNITVHDGDVILEIPVHPLTEGDSLTLHCLDRYTRTSNLRADFYKGESLLQSQTAGEMNIHTVSQSDEGVYYCKHPERGQSPHSWLSVKGSESPLSVLPLLSSLLSVSPYLLVSIILGVKCYRARDQTGKPHSQRAVIKE